MWFDKDTGDFVGHAMALEETDDYLAKPALPAMMAVKLYGESLARYGACARDPGLGRSVWRENAGRSARRALTRLSPQGRGCQPTVRSCLYAPRILPCAPVAGC
jgi:hypothetical protein